MSFFQVDPAGLLPGGDRLFTELTDRMPSGQLTYYVCITTLTAIVLHVLMQAAKIYAKLGEDRRALEVYEGPKQHWLLGNLGQLLVRGDVLAAQVQLIKEFPKACKVRLGWRYMLRVYHPDYIKHILTSEPKDEFTYHFLVPWLGDGLLISKGHKWARNRRLLTPAFNFDILKPYVNVFSQSSLTMVEKWRRMLSKSNQPIEMFEHVSLMTLDSLMKCIFGCQDDCQREGYKHPYIKGVYELADLISERFRHLPHHNDFIYSLSWGGYKFRRACRLVHTYSQRVIHNKKMDKLNGTNKTLGEGKFLDFLDMLVDAKDEDGKGLTDEEIQAEVDTFMFEGHDTTASGISWCLYNLARHPEYQAKCRDEVNSVLGDREHFTWDDLHRLNFLTLCIKESLRLHPPVPNISRRLTKPVTFPDGKTLPAGMWVGVLIYATHHNPNVWDNPSVFDPYRFTAENSQKRPPHAYIPFSAGPRNCIGQHFALNEIKVAVGQVIRHMNLSPRPDDTPQLLPRLVIRAKGGLFLKVTPIEH